MRIPSQSLGVLNSPQAEPLQVIPSGFFDDLCSWINFPWCDAPQETCYYDRTDTSCWGVVEMCKDRGWTASGKSCASGWYVCGACLGLPF